MEKQRVAIVKVVEQRIDEAMGRIADLLGGLDDVLPVGGRILLKPNFVFPPTDRGVTHTELVEAVVRLVAEHSPGRILIAEGSADVYTTKGFRFQGMSRIAARYGARLVDLNLEEGIKTPVPAGLGREYIMVPKVLAESDAIISLPVWKLWGGNPLSLSLKNLVGCYGGRYYGYNKDSQHRGYLEGYSLPGELGIEMGAHQPDTHTSICALNVAIKTHLTIIDGLEGGDGRGNFMRLDTLIAGRNPVATDAIAYRLAHVDPAQVKTFQLCQQYGLGVYDMDRIEVLGESMADASFDLARLRDNVLEVPVDFCLNLLSTGELLQIQQALYLYELIDPDTPQRSTRDELLATLAAVIGAPGYYSRAMAKCSAYARDLLGIIAREGGTSGSLVGVRKAFDGQHEGLLYHPSNRNLTRLGLAYEVDSATRNYYLLPKGLVASLSLPEQESES